MSNRRLSFEDGDATVWFEIDEAVFSQMLELEIESLNMVSGDFCLMNSWPVEKLGVLKKLRVTGKSKQKNALDWIQRLEGVESVVIDHPIPSNFDFENICGLKKLSAPYCSAVKKFLQSDAKIVSFGTSKFSGTFDEFSDSVRSNLEVLGIGGGKLTTLDGLDGFTKIKDLWLGNMRQLENIDALKSMNNQLAFLGKTCSALL